MTRPAANRVHTSPFRTYRATRHAELVTFQVVIEESDIWAAARTDLSAPLAEHLYVLRSQIKTYAAIYPEFLSALTPLATTPHAPEIIRRMAEAAKKTGVGPMAAVAGTVAQMLAEHLRQFSADILVENGGDTYLHSSSSRHVGILYMPDKRTRLGVPVAAEEFPCSFCASSAKIGHSLSFGNADLVVVRARDASLADAAATALANRLTEESDMDQVLEQAQTWEAIGIDGLFAQCGERVGVWGKMELAVL